MGSKGPNLRGYLDKHISLSLNKGRKVTGTLRGYDQFMNIVLGDCVEETKAGVSATSSTVNSEGLSSNTEQNSSNLGMVVIRGNSIVQFELIG